MAMDGVTMGDAVADAIAALDPTITADQKATLKAAWEVIGPAIVQHIQNNAVVSVTTSGVSPGGSSLPGSGTIS